jgi:hypothetical protein
MDRSENEKKIDLDKIIETKLRMISNNSVSTAQHGIILFIHIEMKYKENRLHISYASNLETRWEK